LFLETRNGDISNFLGVHSEKVPKWSKAAFQDKFNIMKGKLERQKDNGDADGDGKHADIDASLARLQKKLRDGSAMETGQRGANKVSALAEELIQQFPATTTPDSRKTSLVEDVADKDGISFNSLITTPVAAATTTTRGSESCHFCEKRVYVVERMSAEGRFFHRSCFRCDYCGILLRLGSYVHHRDGHFSGEDKLNQVVLD
jgi:hypothetical protein